MKFDYYYGSEADQFNFIRIPKAMVTDPLFADLSLAAKFLYGILLDRMNLSMKNKWFDEENRVYIIYQVSEVMEDMNISQKLAIKYLNELESFGLVEKKRRGLGLPSLIYVKSFLVQHDYAQKPEEGSSGTAEMGSSETVANNESVDEKETLEAPEDGECLEKVHESTGKSLEKVYPEAEKPCSFHRTAQTGSSRIVDLGSSRTVEMGSSRTAKREVQELPVRDAQSNTNSNDTNIIKTYVSIPSNRIVSPEQRFDSMRDANAYEKLIKKNIEYDCLVADYKLDKPLLDNIVSLMLETVLCTGETILIASSQFPAELVKSRMLKLNQFHIQYVMDCFQKNTTKVVNIKKYLLAALFNSYTTIDSYYTAEVHHDFPQYAAH